MAKKYEPVPSNVSIKRVIDRSEVTVSPVNTRCPIAAIKNRGNFDRGFDAGFPLYERGEELRKSGNEVAAIKEAKEKEKEEKRLLKEEQKRIEKEEKRLAASDETRASSGSTKRHSYQNCARIKAMIKEEWYHYAVPLF